jgi:Bacterial dnaA protein helix-turn-helix
MGKQTRSGLSGQLVHLNLRGRRPDPLVRDEEDWRALVVAAKRMLFWCGGYVHGCRCEGREIRFAIRVGHTSIAIMVHHILVAYGIHLRRRHGWAGSIFKRYIAIPVDAELFLDDLVLWLHRPPELGKPAPAGSASCWTTDSAYVTPKPLSWVTTEPVLGMLSPGGAGRSAYHRRKTQPMEPEVVAILNGRAPPRQRQPIAEEFASNSSAHSEAGDRLSIEKIARFVAEYSHVPYEDMRSASRRRVVSKAKTVATVLATRNGASVAAVGRLFGRSRSNLIERAERYRDTQAQLFAQAERALGEYVEGKRG